MVGTRATGVKGTYQESYAGTEDLEQNIQGCSRDPKAMALCGKATPSLCGRHAGSAEEMKENHKI
jgi:hypothetical protein